MGEIVTLGSIDNWALIRALVETLADESDNFPFSSEDMNMSDESFRCFLDFLISSPNSTLVLSYEDKVLAGLGYLEGGKKPRTFHLANLGIGVLKAFQGKGLGGKIIDELLRFASEGEFVGKIDVFVRADNKDAIKLYRKKGFVFEGKSSRSLFVDGEFVDMIYMGLVIE